MSRRGVVIVVVVMVVCFGMQLAVMAATPSRPATVRSPTSSARNPRYTLRNAQGTPVYRACLLLCPRKVHVRAQVYGAYREYLLYSIRFHTGGQSSCLPVSN